jgi:hypothetical protein
MLVAKNLHHTNMNILSHCRLIDGTEFAACLFMYIARATKAWINHTQASVSMHPIVPVANSVMEPIRPMTLNTGALATNNAVPINTAAFDAVRMWHIGDQLLSNIPSELAGRAPHSEDICTRACLVQRQ